MSFENIFKSRFLCFNFFFDKILILNRIFNKAKEVLRKSQDFLVQMLEIFLNCKINLRIIMLY